MYFQKRLPEMPGGGKRTGEERLWPLIPPVADNGAQLSKDNMSRFQEPTITILAPSISKTVNKVIVRKGQYIQKKQKRAVLTGYGEVVRKMKNW